MTDVHLGHGSDSFTSQRTSLVDYTISLILCVEETKQEK